MKLLRRALVAFAMLGSTLAVVAGTQGVAHATITTVCGTNAVVYYNFWRVDEGTSHKHKIRVSTDCSPVATGNTGVYLDSASGSPDICRPNPLAGHPGSEVTIRSINAVTGATQQIGLQMSADCGLYTNGLEAGNTSCAIYCLNEMSDKTHYTMEIHDNQPSATYGPKKLSVRDVYSQDSVDSTLHYDNQDGASVYWNVGGGTPTHSYPWTAGDPSHETLTTAWSQYRCNAAASRSNGATMNNPTRTQSGGAGTYWNINVAGTVACGTAKAFDASTEAGQIEAVCVDAYNVNGNGVWSALQCENTPSGGSPARKSMAIVYEGAWQGDFNSSTLGLYWVPNANVGGVDQPAWATRVRVLFRDDDDGALHWQASA